MTGHIVVPQKRVEVTSGFASFNGNLTWFNTRGMGFSFGHIEDIRSTFLKLEFGFCLGKRERYTRVHLSPVRYSGLSYSLILSSLLNFLMLCSLGAIEVILKAGVVLLIINPHPEDIEDTIFWIGLRNQG